MPRHLVGIIAALGLCLLVGHAGAAQLGARPSDSLADMQSRLAAAKERGAPWRGPEKGPPAQPAANIAVFCEDLRNGGILGVAKGVTEAAKVIGWNVRIYDAGGSPAGRDKAMAAALAAKPDGLVVVGADAKGLRARLESFAERGTPMVGWHVGPMAGPVAGSPIAVNVSTDPLEVARITAMAAVVEAKGRAGVVIFTDSNFEIAMAKANAMADVIRACKECTLLEVRDLAISKAPDAMPAATRELLMRYGLRWTHALAINDIYFDYAVPELTRVGRASKSLSLLSAGDGSAAAFLRIRAGAFQTATVAEPLNLQGWQLVDELNRLLAHEPTSGFVTPVHLVTAENQAFDGGLSMLYDPDNGYRDIYKRIWKR